MDTPSRFAAWRTLRPATDAIIAVGTSRSGRPSLRPYAFALATPALTRSDSLTSIWRHGADKREFGPRAQDRADFSTLWAEDDDASGVSVCGPYPVWRL